jgi:hypothetical protein
LTVVVVDDEHEPLLVSNLGVRQLTGGPAMIGVDAG